MSTDGDVREKLLEELCKSLVDNSWQRQEQVNGIAEKLTEEGIGEDSIEYQINRLVDEGRIDGRGGLNGTISIRASGVDEYENLSGETIVPKNVQSVVLEILNEAERENPNNPRVDRDTVLEEIDSSEPVIDRTVWYLNEKGFIEITGGMGNNYMAAEISGPGRNEYEREFQ